jgi:succinyl-diaminopimelate desuccinylase
VTIDAQIDSFAARHLASSGGREAGMQDELAAAIEARREEMVDLARALVRIPTVNPPGEAYGPCARLIGERLRRRGFQIAYIRGIGSPGDSDRFPRTNVVARFESGRPGPCVHLNGHIDVVLAGSGWTVDPFAGVVRDGRLYGRGACDMKAGLAAAIVAVEVLVGRGLAAGSLEISGTVDEESGGFGGVAHLARQGFFAKGRVDHVIIPEPLDVARVCLGHRGVWWAEVETFGRIAHGSMPFLGDCAIRHMAAFLRRLEDDLWPRLLTRTTAMPVVPDAARHSTLNLTAIHGGLAETDGLPSPVVPHACKVLLDRRFLIEEDLEEVKAEVVALLEALRQERPGFRYAVREVMEVLPVMTERDAPVARAVAAAIRQVLGREPSFIASPGTYDQKHIQRIAGLGSCIAYGPGRLELAHQPDEFVEIEEMVQSAKVMALACRALTGGG